VVVGGGGGQYDAFGRQWMEVESRGNSSPFGKSHPPLSAENTRSVSFHSPASRSALVMLPMPESSARAMALYVSREANGCERGGYMNSSGASRGSCVLCHGR
jgi:hypothetical protein